MNNKQLQRALRALGFYHGNIDGIIGTGSKSAIKMYQKWAGLNADGIAGTKTISALKTHIKQIQSALNSKNKAGLTVDGFAGDNTEKAIKTYQKKAGLTQDGIVGSGTAKSLGISWTKVASSGSSSGSSSGGNYSGSGYTVSGESSTHFKKSEFICGCIAAKKNYCNGYPATVSSKLLNVLEKIRAHYGGKAMRITSGVRCQKWNDSLAGSIPNSKHTKGKAADFVIAGRSANDSAIVSYAWTLADVSYTYTGFGAVHVDVA